MIKLNTEFNRRIAGMKEIILAIHRSAGELDYIVERIENASIGLKDDEEGRIKMAKIIEQEFDKRQEMSFLLSANALEGREDYAWEKLLASVRD